MIRRLGAGRRAAPAVLALALAALALVASAAFAAVPPSPGSARLVGAFELASRVTVAVDIPGERTGQAGLRRWTFFAPCPVGPCSTVILVRARAHARDTVKLRRRAPGYYTGTGRFSAPLRCGTRTFPGGALVPFTIAVRVTAATGSPAGSLAARVRATYSNRRRINLTPCVGALGHDSATYHGHLVGSS